MVRSLGRCQIDVQEASCRAEGPEGQILQGSPAPAVGTLGRDSSANRASTLPSVLDAERMPPRTGACSAQHPDPLVCMRPPLVQMDAKLVPGFEKQALTSKPFFAIYKDGEIIEQVEGINTPLLEKFIGDTIPEGILEIEEEPAEGDEDD